MNNFRYEQKLLTDIPADGRFVTELHPSSRRYYVVVKHYMGYEMMDTRVEDDKDGKPVYIKRKNPNVTIPRCRVKYISHYEKVAKPGSVENIPVWVESVWDSEDVYVMHLNDDYEQEK